MGERNEMCICCFTTVYYNIIYHNVNLLRNLNNITIAVHDYTVGLINALKLCNIQCANIKQTKW